MDFRPIPIPTSGAKTSERMPSVNTVSYQGHSPQGSGSGGNLQGLGSSRSSTAFTDGGDSEAAVSNLIWIKLLSFLKNLVFVLALISLVCLTLIQGIQCVNKFLASPTYISTEVVDQFEAEFPAMTICPSGYRLDVLKSYGYGSVRKYNYHNAATWKGNSSTDAGKVFDDVTFGLWEILDSVKISLLQPQSNGEETLILKDQGESSSDLSFLEVRHRAFGKCYTLHPEEWIRQLGINIMEIKTLIDSKVYLHRPGQFLDLSGRMGYKVFLGDQIQSQINYQDVRMVSKVLDDGSQSCSTKVFDECIYTKVTRLMYEKAPGCTVPWIMNNSIICTEPSAMNISHWITWNRITNQRKDCLSPCNFLMINVGSKNHEFLNESTHSVVSFYFAPRVMQSIEHFLYPFLSLAAEIGGYVGLLLGVSFFHLARFIRDSIDERLLRYRTQVNSIIEPILIKPVKKF